MLRNEPTKEEIREIEANVPDDLKFANEFILQTCTKKNKLLTDQFLARPADEVLKQIFIIRAVCHNFRDANPDPQKLIDSLIAKEIPTYELLDNYFDMLFLSVANKNKPFNLSKIDIKPGALNLKDDTEKAMLFLKCMDFCGTMIWGYMNVPKPANTKEAYAFIKKYPKFNGRPYYQYSDFYFTDFKMEIVKDKGPQSFKAYYLNKYYETLLSHLLSLNKEGASDKEKDDLLLGSILKERNLYQYTEYRETLESIFKAVKKE